MLNSFDISHWSLRQKLVSIILLSNVVCIFVCISVLTIGSLISRHNDSIQEISSLSDVLAENSQAALVFNDHIEAQRLLESLVSNHDISSAWLITPDNNAIATWNRKGVSEAIPFNYKVESRDLSSDFWTKHVELHSPIKKNGEVIGYVLLKADFTERVNSQIADMLRALVGGFAALIVVFILAIRLQRLITRPIEEVSDAARSIAHNQTYELRVTQRTDDEIGNMVAAFNAMLDEIHARDEKLINHQSMLEEKIEERTAQLQHSKLEAEAASHIKGMFLANMSHEIRTPINSILGMTYLALRTEEPKKMLGYLEKIQLSSKHLLNIINDVLDFSKLAAGKLKVDEIDFDLKSVLEKIGNLIADKAAEKDLEFIIDLDANLCSNLRGDPQRITQILINYASNAVKFTEKGRVVVRAQKIEENEVDCLMHFEVQDSGIGMDVAAKDHLFQPFHQLDTSATRQYEGTGLGLAICRQLAEVMPDGDVGVQSMLGVGSTFWFRVRLKKTCQSFHKERVTKNLAETNDGTHANPFVPAALRGARILVAEDNLFGQQVITEFLENAGASVCVARNGLEVIDLLQKEDFNCVLMDVQMPVMNGLEAVRLIRTTPDLAGLPVIAMTANVMNENRERCLAAGMNDFISKPFEPDDFYNVIVRYLSDQLPSVLHEKSAAMTMYVQGANDQAIIDFSVLNRLVGDNELKMREFTLKFLASVRLDMSDVDVALQHNDLEALRTLGHHIKGAAKMFGANRLAELCSILEIDIRDGECMKHLQDVVGQMHRLLEQINECIDENLT